MDCRRLTLMITAAAALLAPTACSSSTTNAVGKPSTTAPATSGGTTIGVGLGIVSEPVRRRASRAPPCCSLSPA
jgi:hypothetical protein